MHYDIAPNTGTWFGTDKFKPGDTILFKAGQHAYFSGEGSSGTPDLPVVATFESGVVFSKGIDFTNVSNWILDGGTNKNFYIKGATGVAMGFKGKCNNITIKGVKVENAYSFLWFKTEVNEGAFANWNYWTKNPDGTISANYVMDGLTLDNFTFTNGGFDGCYIGSTGQKADRPVTIDGVQYMPLPAQIKNIKISNGTLNGAARTGMQVSGLIGTGSYLKAVNISNCGTGREAYQGACFRLGFNSPDGFEINGCKFDGSFLYAVQTQCGGLLKFINNTVINSTKVNGVPNVEKMAAVEFDTFDRYPCTVDVEGNTVDGSNNNVSLVIYGSKVSLSADSVVRNNSFQGEFQNQTGQTIITDGGTPVPPDPTPVDKVVSYFQQVNNDRFTLKFFYTDNTNETVSNVKQILYQTIKPSGQYTVTFKDGTKKVMGKAAAADVREETIEEFKTVIDKFIDYLMS
jgi:hypothetical protein